MSNMNQPLNNEIQYRQDLAQEIFLFLNKHALRTEDDQLQWIYDGAYDLCRVAKDLYEGKPLKDIKEPVSDWSRGGYTDYNNLFDFIQHESLKFRIHMLISYGLSGIPERKS